MYNNAYQCVLLFVLKFVAVTCPLLASISNGSIAYSPGSTEPFNFDTVAAHSCDDGFYLMGLGIQTCVGDGSSVLGQWSGILPTCSGNGTVATSNTRANDHWL